MKLIVDIETNGLLDELTCIHCIVAKDVDTGEVHSFRPNEIAKGIKLLESADELIAHNGIKFDVPAIKMLYPSFKSPSVLDTLVCVRLIWSSIKEDDAVRLEHEPGFPRKMFGSHSLKAWGYRLGEHKGEYGQKDNAWDKFTEEMLTYCEQDVRVTVNLYNKVLGKDYSQQALDLEHSVAELMWKQECNGFVFDEKKAQELYINLAEQRDVIYQELYSLFPSWVVSEGTKKPARSCKYKDPHKADRTKDASFTKNLYLFYDPTK